MDKLGTLMISIAFMAFSFSPIFSQISDIQKKGNRLYVYGNNNKELSYLNISSSDELLGTCSSFYIVKKGSRIYTYDYNSKEVGWMNISNSDKFKSAGGNSFNIQKGDRVYTYDKKCKEISWRNL